MLKKLFILNICMIIATSVSTMAAESGGDAAEMAKKMQDPLANIKALMTDNDISFNAGSKEDEFSYGFQLQPVYAIPFEEQGFNLINRAVIPILGIPGGGQKPILGEPTPVSTDHTWGLSDSMLQFFFNPHTDSAWKWGVGPNISIPTRTDDDLKGPGWGAGPIAVLVGGFGENLSTSFITGHLWGEEAGFSTSMLQPMIFYNLPNAWNIHYSNIISYDWNAENSSDAWTVPIGFAVGKMFALKGGHGLEFFAGPYYNAARPDGAAEWTIKWGINWLLP